MQMAGLGYSEEQIELLDVATSFCRDKSPIARVRKLMDSDLGYDADVWAEMAALGWTAIAIPEAHGGCWPFAGRGRSGRRANGAPPYGIAIGVIDLGCTGTHYRR